MDGVRGQPADRGSEEVRDIELDECRDVRPGALEQAMPRALDRAAVPGGNKEYLDTRGRYAAHRGAQVSGEQMDTDFATTTRQIANKREEQVELAEEKKFTRYYRKK